MAEYNSHDKIIVYCVPFSQLNDPDFGLLKPAFEKTPLGLVPADPSTYVNNGKIHVTQGYSRSIGPNDSEKFFKVEASISNNWDPDKAHDGISKYVTYHRNIEPAKYLEISQLFQGDYPEPSKSSGLVCITTKMPLDGFFLRCLNSEGNQVIVGPLDVVKESLKVNENGTFTFQYKGVDKPIGGNFSRINKVPHSTLVFEVDLIPEGVISSFENQEYLVNHQDLLPFTSSKQLDLSSDESVIKWAQKNLRVTSKATTSELINLKNLVDRISGEDEQLPENILEERKNRLRLIPEKLASMGDMGQIFSDYINSGEGQKLIENHIEANKTFLLEKYFNNELEKRREQADREVDKQIEEKNIELQVIETRIKEELEKQKQFQESAVGQELQQAQVELQKIRNEKNIIFKISELETEKKIIERDLNELNIKQNKARAMLEEVQANINQSQETHKQKLMALKMELEAISGNAVSESDLKAKFFFDSSSIQDPEYTDLKVAKIDIINNLVTGLEQRGRVVNFNEVAIMLTCIMQNLITTLAGKPGSGKSSSAYELARTLGITNQGKYVHIQVQRGWSSDRDIIGFYNKLSRSYDVDRFGLYKLINGLQDLQETHQLSFALLDEANLSPIEHYWSGFMGACDNPDSFSTQGEKLSLPKGLRFIATVNYDRTTEPLSARFLDRSPVIYIENKKRDLLYEKNGSLDAKDIEHCYSYPYLRKLFGVTSGAAFTEDEQRIIQELLDKFRFLPIEYRKIQSVRNFTETLRTVLHESGSIMLKAFDFAILVHVLPLISGQGREYGQNVKELYEYLGQQGLTYSSERLRHIIDSSRFDAYSYFI